MTFLRRKHAVGLAVVVLVLALYTYLVFWAEKTLLHGFIVDDAYISLRHSKNFAEGHGLVYTVGERVEAYTNFSLTILAAIPYALGLEPVAFVKAICFVGGISVVLSTGELTRLVAGRPAALVAMLVIAADRRFAFFSAWGLETTLVAAFYVPALVLAAKRRFVAAGIFFFLAAITRMESGQILGWTLFYVTLRALVERKVVDFRLVFRPALRVLLAFGVPYVVYFGWRYSYYGWFFPNTYYAKVGSVSSMWRRGAHYLDECFRGMHFDGSLAWSIGALVVAALVTLVLRVARKEKASASDEALGLGVLVLAVAVTHYAYVVAVGGDHFAERFVYHGFPLLVTSVVFAWSRLALLVVRRPVASSIVGGAASFAAFLPLTLSPVYFSTPDALAGWASEGIFLREHADPKAWLATDAAGLLPLESNLRTIDILGLADEHIAHLKIDIGHGTAGHEKADPAYVIGRKPDYLSTWIDQDGHVGRGFRKYWVFWRDWRLGYRVRTDIGYISPTRVAPIDEDVALSKLAEDSAARGTPNGTWDWGVWIRRSGPARPREFGRFDLASSVPKATEHKDVLVRAQHGHPPTFVMYGPGIVFPPGRYRASFDVKTKSAGATPPEERLCNFDVYDGTASTHERELLAKDWLDTTGRLTAIVEITPLTAPRSVEFRLYCSGAADVEVPWGSLEAIDG